MLGVEIDFGHGAFQIGDGIADDFQIPRRVQPQGLPCVELAGLAENRPRSRTRLDERVQIGIGLRRIAGVVRAAESGDTGVFQMVVGDFLKKGHIHRIGARPAALHVVDAEVIEAQGYLELVGRRKVDVFRLCAVAEGGIVEDNFLGHGRLSVGHSAEPQQAHCPSQATGYSPLKQARQY